MFAKEEEMRRKEAEQAEMVEFPFSQRDWMLGCKLDRAISG